MKVIIDPHTLERAEERGTTEDEIIDVIQTGLPIAAKYDRQGKAKIFPYRKKRQNKYYEQKKIEVYYVIEEDTIVTVTAYVFYGSWKEAK